jgi:hypothetical protein
MGSAVSFQLPTRQLSTWTWPSSLLARPGNEELEKQFTALAEEKGDAGVTLAYLKAANPHIFEDSDDECGLTDGDTSSSRSEEDEAVKAERAVRKEAKMAERAAKKETRQAELTCLNSAEEKRAKIEEWKAERAALVAEKTAKREERIAKRTERYGNLSKEGRAAKETAVSQIRGKTRQEAGQARRQDDGQEGQMGKGHC